MVRVSHTFREANYLADCVTGLILKLISDFVFWSRPPKNMKLILFSDVMNFILSRKL